MRTILMLGIFTALVPALIGAPVGENVMKRLLRNVETDVPAEQQDSPVGETPVEPHQEPKDEENTPGAFQGDMMLTNEQRQEIIKAIDLQYEQSDRQKRKATSSILSKRWHQGIIPYVISGSSAGDRAVIEAAMDHWMRRTCLKFRPRQFGDKAYLAFFKGDGCWSYVGRLVGRQRISIGQGCGTMGIVAHEIGHAIGFHHEQSRPDRDNYITVHFNNIQKGSKRNFKKYAIYNGGVPYDVGSIMHYGSHGFSRNGRPTITTKNPRLMSLLGNRRRLSSADIALANIIYCNKG